MPRVDGWIMIDQQPPNASNVMFSKNSQTKSPSKCYDLLGKSVKWCQIMSYEDSSYVRMRKLVDSHHENEAWKAWKAKHVTNK